MGDRRPHRRPSWRVREAIGARRGRPHYDDELERLVKSGDLSPATMARVAELLVQAGSLLPPATNGTADQNESAASAKVTSSCLD
jgi:hypothetical protein